MSPDLSRSGDGDCGGNAAPYVLGALTAAEHDAFVAHLDTCAVCREEVASLQTVAAALPAAVPQLKAPRETKRRVMAEVRRDARAQRSAVAGEGRGARRGRLLPVLAPLALALTVIALLAVVLSDSGQAGARVVRAEVSIPGASGAVRLSGSHGELRLAGMPQTPRGRVYELWLKRAGAPEATDALFTVSSRGDATVGVPGSVSGVKLVMVTSEPLGGSSRPSGSPVVLARL